MFNSFRGRIAAIDAQQASTEHPTQRPTPTHFTPADASTNPTGFGWGHQLRCYWFRGECVIVLLQPIREWRELRLCNKNNRHTIYHSASIGPADRQKDLRLLPFIPDSCFPSLSCFYSLGDPASS